MMSACQNRSVRTNYVLIDYENVQVASLDLLKGEHFRLWIFLGPNDTRLTVPLALAIHEFRERAVYVPLKTGGANALDFHIAYYFIGRKTPKPRTSRTLCKYDSRKMR